MDISISAARTHVLNAERRFREYERFISMKENDREIEVLTLTHGEIKLLVNVLSKYEQDVLHKAYFNVKSDWQSHVPYEARIAVELSQKLQRIVYGEVRFEGILHQLLGAGASDN